MHFLDYNKSGGSPRPLLAHTADMSLEETTDLYIDVSWLLRRVLGGRDEMRGLQGAVREEGCIRVQTNTSLEFYTALRCSVFGFQAALHY